MLFKLLHRVPGFFMLNTVYFRLKTAGREKKREIAGRGQEREVLAGERALLTSPE